MNHLGDFAEDATVDFKWSTNSAAGASITRATDGTISVYIGNGTTQLTTGVTDTEDFDSLTGVHHCRIDLSASASYAPGSECQVVLSASTIDGQTVNAVLATFSIERAGGVLAVLKGLLESSSDGNIFKAVSLQNADVTVRSSVGLASANLDTQLAALQTDTNDIQTRIPAALVGGRMDSDMGAISTDAAAANNLEAALDGTGGVTLTLASIAVTAGVTISNATGSALTVSSSGSNGNGIDVSGNGSGSGIRAVGGATGHGVLGIGGASAGDGVHGQASASGGNGIYGIGNGTGDGLHGQGGAMGRGIHGLGGSTSGAGIRAEGVAGNAHGLECVAHGTGTDLAADNIATATAVDALPTNAELATALGTADDAVLAAIAIVDSNVDTILVTTNKLDNTVENTSDGYIFTVNGLQNAPSGTGASPSAIADEVQTRTIAAVTVVNGLSADAADDVWDEVIEGAVTARQSVRLANSALGGKASGLATTEATFRDLGDTKDRLVATVDADGNRSAVTRDLT